MSEIFDDTMNGLMEAIAIEKGEIDLIKVPNMPGDTYRSSSVGVEANSETESGALRLDFK